MTVDSRLLELAAISVLYFLQSLVYSCLKTTESGTGCCGAATAAPPSFALEGMLAIASV